MKHPFELLGGIVVLIFVAATFVQIVQPTSLSHSVSVYQESVVLPVDGVETMVDSDYISPEEDLLSLQPEPVEIEIEAPVISAPIIICAEDAQLCSDGSTVSRVMPDCTFTTCPAGESIAPSGTVFCPTKVRTDMMCLDVYEPVCGTLKSNCIGTSCSIVTKTFGNGCGACQGSEVFSYLPGKCGEEFATH